MKLKCLAAIVCLLIITLLPNQVKAEEPINAPAVMAVIHGSVIDIDALRGLEFAMLGERLADEDLDSIEARGVDTQSPIMAGSGKIILWDDASIDERSTSVFSRSTGTGNKMINSLTGNNNIK